jgi:hypothetical protein
MCCGLMLWIVSLSVERPRNNMYARIKKPSYHSQRKLCIDFGCELYFDT